MPALTPYDNDMWVVFVVSYLPCSERFFSGFYGFTLSSKTNQFPNSNSCRNKVDEKPLAGCATSKSLLLLFIIYLNSSAKL